MTKEKILFICLGNICRSPMAETVMNKLLEDKGLSDKYEIDSAGLDNYHEGEKADRRMRSHACFRGYDITHISRPMTEEDWYSFDRIICMDEQNRRTLERRAPSLEFTKKIELITDYCRKYSYASCVPDPYYGGDQGFENVIDLLEDACEGILSAAEKSTTA